MNDSVIGQRPVIKIYYFKKPLNLEEMAKVKGNLFTEGMTGKVGGKMVFKYRKGNQYVSQSPDTSNVIATEYQTKNRKGFADAVAYARFVIENPGMELPFKVKKRQSLYNAAISYYKRTHKDGTGEGIPTKRYTAPGLEQHALNPRQIKAVLYLHKKGVITNGVYQQVNKVSKATATRDLQELASRKIIQPSGAKGRGAIYFLIS